MKKFLTILLSLAFGLVSFQSINAAEPEIPTIPEVSFSYASLHAIDHTHIVIPVSKGWHKDVGITVTPEPYGSSVGADKIVAGLTSGSFDVMSGSTVFSLAGYDVNNNYRDFGHGDIFQGFGFMIDPNGSYKTIDQFIDGGMDPKEAINATMAQFKGKTLSTLNEGGILGFINIALESAGLTLDDLGTVNKYDTDSKIMADLIAGRSDFAVGSAPGRVSMTLEGFVPALTSLHVSKYAEASPDSKALRSIFHDGWATTPEFYAANKDTIFRFMSMMYRTLRLMVDHPEETIPIHADYVNSIMGSNLTPEDTVVIYEELDPFIAFEDQAVWYEDRYKADNAQHLANVLGSHIKLWEEQGVLNEGEWTPYNTSYAFEMWHEFQERKVNAHKLIRKAESLVTANTKTANDLLAKAKFYDDIYDFLDAERFAQAAIEWAEYEK